MTELETQFDLFKKESEEHFNLNISEKELLREFNALLNLLETINRHLCDHPEDNIFTKNKVSS